MSTSEERSLSKTKREVSWKEVDDIVSGLALQIKAKDLDIYAIGTFPFGGLIPASMLAYKLKVSVITSVLDWKLQNNSFSAGWLFLDDVCDTGLTFKSILGERTDYYTACLCLKPWSKFKPTFSGFTTEDFIVFPWEK